MGIPNGDVESGRRRRGGWWDLGNVQRLVSCGPLSQKRIVSEVERGATGGSEGQYQGRFVVMSHEVQLKIHFTLTLHVHPLGNNYLIRNVKRFF